MAFRKTKAPPGRPKLSGKRKPIDRAQQHRKWLHQALKSLQKELKKAKNFETQKIKRRIKQAQDAASAEGTTAGVKAAHQLDVDKLQAQIQAVKAVNPIALANKIALSAGLLEGSQGPEDGTTGKSQETDQPPQELVSNVLEVVQQRMIRAACVRKQLDALTEEHSKLFKDKAGSNDTQQKQGVQGSGSDEELENQLEDAGLEQKQPRHEEQSQPPQLHEDTAEHRRQKRQKTGFQHPLLARGGSDSEDEESGSVQQSGSSQDLDDEGGEEVQGASENDGSDEEMIDAVLQRLTAKQRRNRKNGAGVQKSAEGDLGGPDDEDVRHESLEHSSDSQDDFGHEQDSDVDSGLLDDNFEGMSGQEEQQGSESDDANGMNDNSMDIDEHDSQGQSDGSFDSEDFDDFNSEDFDRDVNGKTASPSADGSPKPRPKTVDDDEARQYQRQQRQQSRSSNNKPNQADSDRNEGKPKGKQAGGQGVPGKSKKSLSAREWIEKRNRAQDPVTGKPKNRLGQKARRALYEKMYGKSALHLKQPPRPPQSNASGRPTKSRYGRHSDDQGLLAGKHRRHGSSLQEAKPNAKVLKPTTDQSELHPSWAARKAAKQKIVIDPISSPAAKKIKFDDDVGANQGSKQSVAASSGHKQGDRQIMPPARHGRIEGGGSQKGKSWQSEKGVGFDNRNKPLDSRGSHAANGSKSQGLRVDKQLHPSWVAKQAMKQQQNTLVPATGKKIVFDD